MLLVSIKRRTWIKVCCQNAFSGLSPLELLQSQTLWHGGVFKPSSAVKGMQRSPKTRKRTSCPGDLPGCWSAVNEGLFSVSAAPTGKVLCLLLHFKTQSQPWSSVFFWCTHDLGRSKQMYHCTFPFRPGQQLISKTTLETDSLVNPP